MAEPRQPGYETSDLSARAAGLSLLGVAVLVLVSLAIILGVTVWFKAQRPPDRASPLERVNLVPPGPRLQPNPSQDRRAIESSAEQRLRTYGWTDRNSGLARVPIERAMQMQAALGWPDPEEPQQ